jgi:hypothetical protein
MKQANIYAVAVISFLAGILFVANVDAVSEYRWAKIVLEIIDDSNSVRFQQMATMQMKAFGTASTEVLGQNIEVLGKNLSISAIQKKYGKPDKVENASKDEKGIKIEVQRYSYRTFVLETKAGNDIISWLYAPCGYWADDIRKIATEAIKKEVPGKSR